MDSMLFGVEAHQDRRILVRLAVAVIEVLEESEPGATADALRVLRERCDCNPGETGQHSEVCIRHLARRAAAGVEVRP